MQQNIHILNIKHYKCCLQHLIDINFVYYFKMLNNEKIHMKKKNPKTNVKLNFIEPISRVN